MEGDCDDRDHDGLICFKLNNMRPAVAAAAGWQYPAESIETRGRISHCVCVIRRQSAYPNLPKPTPILPSKVQQQLLNSEG